MHASSQRVDERKQSENAMRGRELFEYGEKKVRFQTTGRILVDRALEKIKGLELETVTRDRKIFVRILTHEILYKVT